MPEHVATAAMIAVRSLTAVGVVEGTDRDIRVVVALRAVVLGDEADSLPMVVFSVASRVTVGASVLFVPSKNHLYHPGALIARAGLHHFRVHRDRLSPASLVSPPLIRPNSSTSTSIVLRRLVIRVIHQDIKLHLGVRAPTRLQVQELVPADRD